MKPALLVGLLLLPVAVALSDRPWPVAADTHTLNASSTTGDGFTYGSYSSDDDGHAMKFQYAIVEPGGNTSCAVSDWQDSQEQISRLSKEAQRIHAPLFWFRQDGKSWIVRDAALTARATDIVRPMQELGAQQGKLGAEQGRWGALQGKLGALLGRIGAMQARIAVSRIGESDADRRELADLERQADELSAEAGRLGEEQGRLGEKQGALGKKQGELGRQQAVVSKQAFKDLRALAQEALASGKAEPYRG